MVDPKDKHKHKHDKHKGQQGKHPHVNKYADLAGKTGKDPVIDVISQKNSKEFTPHMNKPTAAKDQYTRDEAQKHKNDQQRKKK